MEETTEKTKTVSLSDLKWRRVEVVLGIVSLVGFAWLVILLVDALTHPAVIVEYAPADPRSRVWIQGVQFSQLVVAFTLSGLFGAFRTAKWVIQELRSKILG
jgi:hypothetical protein